MSGLNVPLTVRVGDRHVTREVQSVSFRKEAIGGVRSISFTLSRPLSEIAGVDPMAKVYVQDGRTAEAVAEGRLADTGRSAGSDGQKWDCVAFGPVQHASDIASPVVYIDKSLDGWSVPMTPHSSATIASGTLPGPVATDAPQGILAQIGDGTPVTNTSYVALRYDRVWQSGQTLGGYHFQTRAYTTTASWLALAVTRTNADVSGGEFSYSTQFNAAGTTANVTVGTFPASRNTIELWMQWNDIPITVTGEMWVFFFDVTVRPQLLQKDGTNLGASSHANSYIVAHDVVGDLLGRMLPEFDGANAIVATGGAFQIEQFAYPDGATASAVLEDLMALEPAYRWTTGADTTGGGYSFRWEPWPTTVRYEATLNDGGSFPLSAQDLFNQVIVRWKDESGTTRTTLRTSACAVLDDAGLVRRTVVDLGSEVGSQVQADHAAEKFLAEHNVPKNSGTLTVARPIRDVLTGRMVDPWEIEAGELIRVLGVEAYPDAFNASTNDGQGVFRIHALDYASDSNSASLSLDADPSDTASALAKLLTDRRRR